MSTDPEIHPPAEGDTLDTQALGETIEYLNSLHARMADRLFRVTTRDSDLTASLPKRLRTLQKELSEAAYQAAQENSRD